jgi:hypothetical protein
VDTFSTQNSKQTISITEAAMSHAEKGQDGRRISAKAFYNMRGYSKSVLITMCIGLKAAGTGADAPLVDLNVEPWSLVDPKSKKIITPKKCELLAEMKRRCFGSRVPKATKLGRYETHRMAGGESYF